MTGLGLCRRSPIRIRGGLLHCIEHSHVSSWLVCSSSALISLRPKSTWRCSNVASLPKTSNAPPYAGRHRHERSRSGSSPQGCCSATELYPSFPLLANIVVGDPWARRRKIDPCHMKDSAVFVGTSHVFKAPEPSTALSFRAVAVAAKQCLAGVQKTSKAVSSPTRRIAEASWFGIHIYIYTHMHVSWQRRSSLNARAQNYDIHITYITCIHMYMYMLSPLRQTAI